MAILDNGTETLVLHPLPEADTPVTLAGCWLFPVAATEPYAGLTLITDYEVYCRSFPVGAWSKVTWRGRDWDVVGEPMRFYGPASVAHDVVRIRARSAETYG